MSITWLRRRNEMFSDSMTQCCRDECRHTEAVLRKSNVRTEAVRHAANVRMLTSSMANVSVTHIIIMLS